VQLDVRYIENRSLGQDIKILWKTVPADRPGVAHLAENIPLAIAPLLGKSTLEYWLEALVARGVRHVSVLASDRPQQVRAAVGSGRRWGLTIDVVTQSRELTVEQARA
jgi:NDP-sugar pyrophosphorylase family protein